MENIVTVYLSKPAENEGDAKDFKVAVEAAIAAIPDVTMKCSYQMNIMAE